MFFGGYGPAHQFRPGLEGVCLPLTHEVLLGMVFHVSSAARTFLVVIVAVRFPGLLSIVGIFPPLSAVVSLPMDS